MSSDASRHPEVETMAAFIEGTLAPSDLAAVKQHLGQCEDCRTVVSETARFEREESSSGSGWMRFRTMKSLLAAAAIGAVALSVPLVQRIGGVAQRPVALLIEAAPRDHRLIEPRLSGFEWAQFQAPQRGTPLRDPADLKLDGTAGTVLLQTAGDTAPASRHGAGLAHLFTGRPAESIEALEQAANASSDPTHWSDLAAARYVAAADDERSAQLPLALAAADHALRLDPSSREAHFNRALILERLAMRDQARAAWQKYLQLDSGSGWAVEARGHLKGLSDPAASVGFEEALQRASGNRSAVAAVVRAFPQDSRTWAEGPFLSEWADAERKGDRDRADERLALARELGAVLASASNEHFAADAVAAIDRADGASRLALADAHRSYRAARIDQNELPAVAEQQFRRAAAVFREHGSVMAVVASYRAATTLILQNRAAAASDELRAIQSRLDPRHRGLVAQVHWDLSTCASIAGDWGSMLREADASFRIFESLHEGANAASMGGQAAYALERIGATDLAWSRRIRALAGLAGERHLETRGKILHAAALALESSDRVAAAESVMDVAIQEGRDGSVNLLTLALADRALLASRSGDVATARRALRESRTAARQLKGAGQREIAAAKADLGDAVLQRSDDARASLTAFDRAIRFFTDRREDALLADAYLQRARAFRLAGDDDSAAADYASAFERVVQQRRSVRDAEVRIAFVDTATQIFEERIDLELSRGAVQQALEESERVHALLRREAAPARGRTPVPAGVVVVKYVLLPKKVAIFCASSSGVVVRTVDVERGELTARIATFNERLRRRVAVRELHVDAAALYAILIAPLRAELAGKEELVLIPDRQLHTVPFAALYDDAREEYLVERYTIRFAVSLAGGAPVGSGAMAPAIVFADPSTPRGPALSSSRQEAQRIAAMHGTSVIAGAAATRERFTAAVRDSALVHYAGHADSDVSEAYGALLLAPSGKNDGVFGSSEIARLELARHPLVVLAGCGTARGAAVHIAGISSIARAFLDAGARAVVGTLWEIEDDLAAQLFLRFHERLRDGAPPARALQEVQSALLHDVDARLAHPATWAPVEVISNG